MLTEAGRARLPHAYDDLAVQALEFLAEQGGADAVSAFARRRAEQIWADINERNLVENVLPTRPRADLVLRKGADHSVRHVRLRKI